MKTINNLSLNNLSLRRAGIAIAPLLFSGGLMAAAEIKTARAQQQPNQQQQNQPQPNQQKWGEELTDIEDGPTRTIISLEEVAEETNKLIGSTVTITGKVDRIIGPNAFIMREMGSIYNDDKVLVVLANRTQVPIVEDREIQVTGEVRSFIAAEFETDYDLTWDFELKRKLEAEYEQYPAVAASLTRSLVEQ